MAPMNPDAVAGDDGTEAIAMVRRAEPPHVAALRRRAEAGDAGKAAPSA